MYHFLNYIIKCIKKLPYTIFKIFKKCFMTKGIFTLYYYSNNSPFTKNIEVFKGKKIMCQSRFVRGVWSFLLFYLTVPYHSLITARMIHAQTYLT